MEHTVTVGGDAQVIVGALLSEARDHANTGLYHSALATLDIAEPFIKVISNKYRDTYARHLDELETYCHDELDRINAA